MVHKRKCIELKLFLPDPQEDLKKKKKKPLPGWISKLIRAQLCFYLVLYKNILRTSAVGSSIYFVPQKR